MNHTYFVSKSQKWNELESDQADHNNFQVKCDFTWYYRDSDSNNVFESHCWLTLLGDWAYGTNRPIFMKIATNNKRY